MNYISPPIVCQVCRRMFFKGSLPILSPRSFPFLPVVDQARTQVVNTYHDETSPEMGKNNYRVPGPSPWGSLFGAERMGVVLGKTRWWFGTWFFNFPQEVGWWSNLTNSYLSGGLKPPMSGWVGMFGVVVGGANWSFVFFSCVCGLVTKFTVPDGWTNPSCPAYNWGQLGVSMDDKWWHGNLKVLPPFLWGVPGCRGTFPQMFIIKVVIVNGQKRQIEEIQHTTNLGCLPIVGHVAASLFPSISGDEGRHLETRERLWPAAGLPKPCQ